jgi:hypothetical protein
MYDPRVTMSMIFLYGRACAEGDHVRAGVLYAQLARAVRDDEEAPRSISEETERGVPRYAEL